MTIVYHMMPDGGFVCGDTKTRMTSYAYPTSWHAVIARRTPAHVAAQMLAKETVWQRVLAPHAKDYDARNWERLAKVQTP